MASSTSVHSRQYHSEPMEQGYPENIFSRSPWEKFEHRKHNEAPVTIWVGMSSVIAAVEIPDIAPADLAVSVLETRLMFRGTHRNAFFSQDVDLHCVVEVHPIHMTERKGTIYILLVKKQEADTVTAEGYGDRYPPIPVLTMTGV